MDEKPKMKQRCLCPMRFYTNIEASGGTCTVSTRHKLIVFRSYQLITKHTPTVAVKTMQPHTIFDDLYK